MRMMAVILVLLAGVGMAGAQDALVENADFVYVCKDGGNGAYEAFPDICRVKDGRLLAVFYDGWEHVSLPKAEPGKEKGGRVTGVFSSDEGKTWDKPFVIYDGPNDDRDPSIAQLSDGRLICDFFTLKPGTEGRPYDGLGSWFVESADAGKTWSDAKQLTNKDYYCSSPVRELPGGKLILGLYAENNGDAFGASTVSTDGGKTWSKPADIPNGGIKLDAETDIIRLKDGKLYAAQRQAKESMRFSISADDGATWSVSEPMGFAGHSPYLHRVPGGEVVCAYRWHQEHATYLSVSADDCKTWGPQVLVDKFLGAYPSIATLKDGSLIIIYYEEGGGSNIRARKFKVNGTSVEWLKW